MSAVGTSTASVRTDEGHAVIDTSREGPIRTCIGCRQRVVATELLRIVVAPVAVADSCAVVPDVRRRAPGRGAWVHPDPECVETAQRRRAFARALRVDSVLNSAAVQDHVAQLREISSDGHSMKRQR